MNLSNEQFLTLVREARSGSLRLPAFQRDWKWERSKVIGLYDSLRKKFPIGSFLFLKHSSDIDFSPRVFSGSSEDQDLMRLALDGQQRITAGIALFFGIENSSLRYFVDINQVISLAKDQGTDLDDEESVRLFLQNLDDGDDYVRATTKQTPSETLLLENHWVPISKLMDTSRAQRFLEAYDERYPENSQFTKYLITPHFIVDSNYQCPVVTLNEDESLSAITKIFSTINTTGKRLTPVEIVTAILFASNINLRDEVEELQQASLYLPNMDSSGEITLQTIALLDGKTPKKSLLPKTITSQVFNRHWASAKSLLDDVGEFLSSRLGVGLDQTGKLVPYDSIFAPMAIVLKHVQDSGLKDEDFERALRKIETWFVGSALAQRYQEGVHNKQEKDASEVIDWIASGDDYKPAWLKATSIPTSMKIASPSGALGKLFKCLMNRAHPQDPIKKMKIGYYSNAASTQDHHIWPKQFCLNNLSGWDRERHNSNLALNMLFLHQDTNRDWHKLDPANQVQQIEESLNNEHELSEFYRDSVLGTQALEILKKPDKSISDFDAFIDHRFNDFCSLLGRWEFSDVEEVDYPE
jgi:hypothetical protein